MKKIILFAIFALSMTILGAYEKNILDVRYCDVPGNFESLLKTHADQWNFNFMPYGKDEGVLWSDPAVRRDAISGGSDNAKRVTAVFGACNEQGLTILVFCAEPELKKSLAEAKALPGSMLEMYFAPGDADNNNLQHWYQFIFGQTDVDKNASDFPWLERDRNFKRIKHELKVETRIINTGYISKVFIPWSLLDNRMPFSAKKDNFWRIGIMRWCPGTSQTWGGAVQAVTSTGYFRLPEFTAAQKDAIRKNILLRAWNDFQEQYLVVNGVDGMEEPWRLERDKAHPRSYITMREEREFMTEVMPAILPEFTQIGKDIARYDELTETQKESLLIRAKRLKQFSFVWQTAYADYLKNKFFSK